MSYTIVCPNLLENIHDFNCDFELLMEEIATTIGTALSFLTEKSAQVATQLQAEQTTFFRLTGALRGSVIVDEQMIENISKQCDCLLEYHSNISFVLPQGHTASCFLHTACVQTKKAIRLLARHHSSNSQYLNLLHYLNAAATYFFLLSLKINSIYGVMEIPTTF